MGSLKCHGMLECLSWRDENEVDDRGAEMLESRIVVLTPDGLTGMRRRFVAPRRVVQTATSDVASRSLSIEKLAISRFFGVVRGATDGSMTSVSFSARTSAPPEGRRQRRSEVSFFLKHAFPPRSIVPPCCRRRWGACRFVEWKNEPRDQRRFSEFDGLRQDKLNTFRYVFWSASLTKGVVSPFLFLSFPLSSSSSFLSLSLSRAGMEP